TLYRHSHSSDSRLRDRFGRPIRPSSIGLGGCVVCRDDPDGRTRRSRTPSLDSQPRIWRRYDLAMAPAGFEPLSARVVSCAVRHRSCDRVSDGCEAWPPRVRRRRRCCIGGWRRRRRRRGASPRAQCVCGSGGQAGRGNHRRVAMVLITGATGNVGREIVNLLLAEGRHVVAVSRNPATAQLPSNAHVITGDPSRPQTLATALKGVEAVLLSPRSLAGAARELVTLAACNGVRHAVVLSSLTVQYGGGLQRFADEFRTIEDVVKNS